MAYKKIPFNKIRINRTYTIAELADVLGVCNTTVWNWIQKGLPVVDRSKKPWLIDGKEAREYLESRFKNSKSKMLYYEFYCVNCGCGVEVLPETIKVVIDKVINGDENHYIVRISGRCKKHSIIVNRFSTTKKMIELLKYYNRNDIILEFE